MTNNVTNEQKSDAVIYSDGEIELNISIDNETIWLTQKQIAELFEVTTPNINMHIKTIFKEKELERSSTIQEFLIVQKEGNREVSRNIEHYSLDMIISVGYRVNSNKATKFRQWANRVLKQYIINGYTINSEKITHQRFKELEGDVNLLKNNINFVLNHIGNNTIEIRQGIFFDGQIFDAYVFVNELLQSASSKIMLLDNYIDTSILVLFSKYPHIKFEIITKSISKQLKLDIQKYNSQYENLTIKTSNKFHDRFLIIDDNEAYHIGASLKDLGKKIFAFSKIDVTLLNKELEQ